MSHPTSIIVYRNPVEQAFWESGIIFPMICAIAVALTVAIVLSKIYERLPWSYRSQSWVSNLLVLLTIASAIATMWFMR